MTVLWDVSVWSWQDKKTSGSRTCIDATEGQREVSRSSVTSKPAFLLHFLLPSWPKCDQLWSNVHVTIQQPKEGTANDFFNSQHSKALFRPGVTYPHVILTGCPTFMVANFIYGIIFAQKCRQMHINAFKSNFHRKCNTNLAVYVLNLPCSHPVQRIRIIYLEARAFSFCPSPQVSILKSFLLVFPFGYLVNSRSICIDGAGLSTRSVIYG